MQQTQRITMVDALRGWALLGLFLVHCVERFELYWIDPQPDVWFDAVFALFSSKAFAIFALLFGFSFATIMGNERTRGGDFTRRFAWRLVLLFVIGTLHALVYRGDILQVLALVGLLLIPFDKVGSDKALLVIAALLFAQVPLVVRAVAATQGADWASATPLFWGDTGVAAIATAPLADVLWINAGPGFVGKWSFYIETGRAVEIAGLFLAGMVIQRRRLFADAMAHSRLWVAILVAGGLGWMAASFAESRLVPWDGPVMAADSVQALFVRYRAVTATAFQVALFVLAWHAFAGRGLAWLAAPGRMTLTLYVGQSLVFVPLFYGFGLGWYQTLSNAHTVLLALATFAAQALVAAWWFRQYRYGPLEWLWRAGTRLTLAVPMRRSATG